MRVIDHIKDTSKTLFSFELLPPLKGKDIRDVFNNIEPLIEFDPQYINITVHREEVDYKTLESGLIEPKVIRKRPGTIAMAGAIKNKYGIDVVPHIVCGGFSKSETEYALIDLNFLDIHNLLVLRGDPLKSQKYFEQTVGGHAHAIDLIQQINDLNNGKYLDDIKNSTPLSFSYGVAGYPEKHMEAPNMESDIYWLKQKVDAGASYVVTQMFFDNQRYYEFVQMAREAGINVPIIPGITPIRSKRQINVLPQVFHISLPEELARELRKCKDNTEAYELGVEWATAQSKDLIKNNVPIIHYYTMGNSDNIKRICKASF
jgi:methylenetetrahydrofolate reductase (NADPH)